MLGNVPTGPALGMDFKDHWAFVTGPAGLTVLDIAVRASPAIVAVHPLPHFENEDVDLCGNTLVIVNDRAARDVGAVMYVAPIPGVWLGGTTATYAPSEILGFGCPTTKVTIA